MDFLGDLFENLQCFVVGSFGLAHSAIQIGDAVLLGLQQAIVVGTGLVVGSRKRY